MRVYVAAALGERVAASRIAQTLRRAGHLVVSGWHETSDTIDPTDEEVRRELLLRNLRELNRADAVVLWVPLGSEPKAAYTEVGYALGAGLSIAWGPLERRSNVFDAFPSRVVRYALEEDIPSALGELGSRLGEALPVGFSP